MYLVTAEQMRQADRKTIDELGIPEMVLMENAGKAVVAFLQENFTELPQKNIFFIPDRNLAHYVASQVPEKNFVYNNGFCPTHERIEAEDVANVKAQHPDAQIVAHGECQESILLMADYVGSTSGIINYVTESDCQEFIVCTEEGVGYKLKTQNPDKTFYYPDRLPVCPNMKKNTLEKILHVLKTGENEVHVSDALRKKKKKPLEKMLELAAK